jgi:hypothetical protein
MGKRVSRKSPTAKDSLNRAKPRARTTSDDVSGLSPLAYQLLLEMAKRPERIEYQTTVLGGIFYDDDIRRLDEAYAELLSAGYGERTGTVVAFGGSTPKLLVRITSKGIEAAKSRAAS